ncbi:hypothetical protein Sjap_001713 [Stephania japonica]|uniref:Kinesin motor domain-containing protein n=1 Tax=Stephania japonica TaxID=461633 RepID=A0AAP0KM06_9MAGN
MEVEKKYLNILAQQEDFWKQRAKQHRLQVGNSNMKYFHESRQQSLSRAQEITVKVLTVTRRRDAVAHNRQEASSRRGVEAYCLTQRNERENVTRAGTCLENTGRMTSRFTSVVPQVSYVAADDELLGPVHRINSIVVNAVSCIMFEVFWLFKVTLLRYDRSGIGLTFFKSGKVRTGGGELAADVGVIPRAVRQIFDTVEAQNADYCMKVTFFELYNEEITDLLAPEDCSRSADDKQKKPISLMEDGKGGVIVRGLEEEVVYSANEIYDLLERGSSKRRTVDTLLNKHSSRSHSIFSISVHVKESTVGGEELIKCGKLNLVDLAGSENISRSGAREGRAREAGEINKSLLTLGRVINALVEHSAHIPYRDSKLTRLLRDSLGGKTKTCIIATISPSVHCLEETLSTLDYAYRAKNIKNKPEANKKTSKAILLKELYLEMERMRQDVRAAREKNGVYIPHERFAQDEANKKALNEKVEKLEVHLELKAKQVDEFRELYLSEQEHRLDLERELDECKIKLETCTKAFQDLQESHQTAISTLKEKEFIISNLLSSENAILERAKELRANLQNASDDIAVLSGEIDQKNDRERENYGLIMNFGAQLDQSLKGLHKTVLGSVSQQQQQLRSMEEQISSFLASKCDASKILELKIKSTEDIYSSGVQAMKELAETLQTRASSDLEHIKSEVLAQIVTVENFMTNAVKESEDVINGIHDSLEHQKELLDYSSRQLEVGLQRSLVSAQVISRATIDFFNDTDYHSSRLMKIIEQDNIKKSTRLASLEKEFKEDSSREEKLALEKIAAILEAMTTKKTEMISKAFRSIDEQNAEMNERFQEEVIGIQKISSTATKEWDRYKQKVETHFLEDTFSAAETKAAMESILNECSNKVDCSRQHWMNAKAHVDCLNKGSVQEIESIVRDKVSADHVAHEEFISLSSSINSEINTRTCDLQAAVNDSLMLDRKVEKEVESMSRLAFDHLQLFRHRHSESVSNIRSQAEQSLTKDYQYQVGHSSNTTPKKKAVVVPTLTSIEELRTPSLNNLVLKMRSSNNWKGGYLEGKVLQREALSPSRTPFAAIN